MTKRFAIIALISLIALPAELEAWSRDEENGWIRRTIRQERRHNSSRSYGYVSPHRLPTIYVRPRSRGGPSCLGSLAAVGQANATEAGALLSAQRVWMRQVSARDGDMYADPTHAEDEMSRCVRADAQDTLLGRAKESIGNVNKICEYRARPCEPSFTRTERDGR